jgi:hypothetical protein
MPSQSAKRTTRRLLKLASLGLAGLLAGLFAGCNTSPNSASHFAATNSSSNLDSHLTGSIEDRQIPSLHHPPSARRLQFGSLSMAAQPTAPNRRSRS